MTTSLFTEFNPKIGVHVDSRLTRFFDERRVHATRYGSLYPHLWDAARRASDGGKRFRPMLVIRTHHELGGENDDAAVDVAAAFELLHTAFLLHDDIIDHDLLRRGIPNLAGGEAEHARAAGVSEQLARQWGEASAILAGDLLIHFAQSLVARIEMPVRQRSALLDLLDDSVFITAAGELADVALSAGLQSSELPQVLQMSSHKTASYSFSGPLRAGAILAGADPEVLAVLGEYGDLVGTAFQLRDDLLGVFGNEAVTGKSTINDLREKKITPLVAYARSTSSWSSVDHLLGKPDLTHDEADLLRGMLELCGARAYVEDLIAAYAGEACGVIAASALPAGLRDGLLGVARTSAERAA
ncbi:MAG: polyprenyl synthetase family protein [Terrimesophilobacter sp.]